jgi:peptidyl-prolyl cis-trans isomerase C
MKGDNIGQRSSRWYAQLCAGIATVAVFAAVSQIAALRTWAQQPDAGAKAGEGLPQALGAGEQLAKPAPPPGPEEVVLTVGDTKLTAAEFDLLLRSLPPDAAQALSAMGKKGFAERYVNLLTLAKEGEKRKVDQSEAFQQMASFQRLMLLGQLTLNDIVTTMGEISGDEVSYYYTAHQNEFQQVNLRGIYVPFEPPDAAASPAQAKAPPAKTAKPKLTEAEAKTKANSLKLRIQAGEKIADLAKKESDHPTAAKGGDFGWVRRGQFAPQIDNVIFALDINQVSVPVKDRFGYFIFEVEQKRNQPLDEVKPAIENALRQQKLGEALGKVQAQYPAVYNPRYFGESAPPVTPPPAAAPAPAK